jgi:hypothetical protein
VSAIGYTDHTGGLHFVGGLVATPVPGVRMGYIDHTGRHQLVVWL